MTRHPCSGCGLFSCDGIECYLESDPEAVEFWDNLNKLLAEAEQLTECRGDPLLRKDAA